MGTRVGTSTPGSDERAPVVYLTPSLRAPPHPRGGGGARRARDRVDGGRAEALSLVCGQRPDQVAREGRRDGIGDRSGRHRRERLNGDDGPAHHNPDEL